MSALQLVTVARAKYEAVQSAWRARGQIWVPGYHLFIAQHHPDGSIAWFLLGMN